MSSESAPKSSARGEISHKDEVIAVLSKVKPELEEKSGKNFEILEVIDFEIRVEQYFVKIKAKEVEGAEQIVHLRLNRHLNGEFKVSEYQLNKQIEDELRFCCCEPPVHNKQPKAFDCAPS